MRAARISLPAVPGSGSFAPVLEVTVDGRTSEWSGDDLADFDAEPLATGGCEVTLRVPLSLGELRELCAAESGEVVLEGSGERQARELQPEALRALGLYCDSITAAEIAP